MEAQKNDMQQLFNKIQRLPPEKSFVGFRSSTQPTWLFFVQSI